VVNSYNPKLPASPDNEYNGVVGAEPLCRRFCSTALYKIELEIRRLSSQNAVADTFYEMGLGANVKTKTGVLVDCLSKLV